MELNPKQLKFCKEYIKDWNASQAAIRAGYSEKGSNVTGVRLLANINIANQIKELEKAQGAKHHITKAKLLDELMGIVQDMRKGSNKAKSNAASTAIKAIDLMAKMLGHYESAEQQEKNIIALQVNVKTKQD